MRPLESRLVDVLREFLDAHAELRRVVARGRSGELGFEDIARLASDDEGAVLFRLKENCHRLFRGDGADGGEIGPEVLFDLAVGSLFHEAMKLRECLYQRDAYGPKVRRLREAGIIDASGLLAEFDKILDGLAGRIDESLAEAEILITRMPEQLRLVLARHPDNALVARFLVGQAARVEPVLGPLPALLEEMYGSPGAGWSLAAASLLDSGFFDDARGALEHALREEHAPEQTRRLIDYARGMHAYLQGRYAESVAALGEWRDAAADDIDPARAELAMAALSRVGPLLDDPDGQLARAARALVASLGPRG